MAEGPWEEYAAKPDGGLKPWEEYAPRPSSTAPLPDIKAPALPSRSLDTDFNRALSLPGITNPEKTLWEKAKEFARDPIISNVAVEGGPPNIGALEIGQGSWKTEPTTKRVRDALAERGGGPVSGVSRGVGNIAAGLTSPENIGLMTGIGMLPKLGAAAAGAYFTGHQAMQLPEQVKAVADTFQSDTATSGDKSQAVTETLGSLGLGYLGAKGAVRDFRTSPQMQAHMKPRIDSDFNVAESMAYELGQSRGTRGSAREMMGAATEGTAARLGMYGLTNPAPALPEFNRDAPLAPLPPRAALPPRAKAVPAEQPQFRTREELEASKIETALDDIDSQVNQFPDMDSAAMELIDQHSPARRTRASVHQNEAMVYRLNELYRHPETSEPVRQRIREALGEGFEANWTGTEHFPLKVHRQRPVIEAKPDVAAVVEEFAPSPVAEPVTRVDRFDPVRAARAELTPEGTVREVKPPTFREAQEAQRAERLPPPEPAPRTIEEIVQATEAKPEPLATPSRPDPRAAAARSLGLDPDNLSMIDNMILDDMMSPRPEQQARGVRRMKQRGAEAGSVPIGPNEQHVLDMVQRREAARRAMQGGGKRDSESLPMRIWYEGRDRASTFYHDARKKLVDRNAPILDTHAAIYKADNPQNPTYSIPPSQEFGRRLADIARSGSRANEFSKRTGLHGAIQSPRTALEYETMSRVALALHANEIDAMNARNEAGLVQSRTDYLAARKGGDAKALEKARKQYEYFKKQKRIETGRTPEQIEADNRLIAERGEQFKPQLEAVRKHVNALEDMMVQSGLKSQAEIDMLRKRYPNYMDFHRIVPQQNPRFLATRGVAHKASTNVIQRLTGSKELSIDDPIGNLLKKTEQVFMEAAQNEAARAAAWHANLPGARQFLRPVSAAKAKTMNAKDYFAYLEDGKPKYVQAPREYVEAAKSLNAEQMGVLAKIAIGAIRVFKTGVTGAAAPLFAAANILRDQAVRHAQHLPTSKLADKASLTPQPVSSRTGDLFGIHSAVAEASVRALLGVVKNFLFRNSKDYDRMVQHSGGGTSYDMFRDNPVLSVRGIRDQRSGTARIRSLHRNGLREIENAMGMFEEFTRLQEFLLAEREALGHGMGPQNAAAAGGKAARETTTDFMRGGEWQKAVTLIYPYANAGIQGSRQGVKTARKDPAGYAVRLAMSSVIPVSIATLYAMSDDKRRKAWMDLADWEKDKNIVILEEEPKKDAKGRYGGIKIPLAPGLNEAATLARRNIEAQMGGDPVKAKEYLAALFNYFNPITGTGEQMIGQTVPQLAKGPLEAVTNKNFFLNSPLESERMMKRPIPERRYDSTTGTAQMIGEAVGASPIKVDHVIKSYFGSAAPQLLHYVDKGRKAVADALPGDNAALKYLRELPVGGESYSEGFGRRFLSSKGGAVDDREIAETDKAADRVATENAPDEKLANSLFKQWKTDPDGAAKRAEDLDAKGELSDAAYDRLQDMIETEKSDLQRWEKDLKVQSADVRAERIIGMTKGKSDQEIGAILEDLQQKKILTPRVEEAIERRLSKGKK